MWDRVALKKNISDFPVPCQTGMSLTKLFLTGNNLIFLARESLVSDIPAWEGKMANLFLQCAVRCISLFLHRSYNFFASETENN